MLFPWTVLNIDSKATFLNYWAVLCFMWMILYYVFATALAAALIARGTQHLMLNQYM